MKTRKKPSQRVVLRALRLHRCPAGYVGPCWGPTMKDIQKAQKEERGARR